VRNAVIGNYHGQLRPCDQALAVGQSSSNWHLMSDTTACHTYNNDANKNWQAAATVYISTADQQRSSALHQRCCPHKEMLTRNLIRLAACSSCHSATHCPCRFTLSTSHHMSCQKYSSVS
jgi:hypothetical protein